MALSAIEQVLQATGLTLEQLRADSEEKVGPKAGNKVLEVPNSSELRRIIGLPRRSSDLVDYLVKELTAALSTPWGQQTLRPIQARALAEIHQCGGLLAPIVVGGGKTLITYLIPEILDAKRPILLVPAKLKEKTRRDFRTLAYHWVGPHPDGFRIESYELLSRVSAGNQYDKAGNLIQPGFLERYRPDVIILDEGHKAKNQKAAVTRRLNRYLRENPGTKIISMSGTFINRSLKDVGHISDWCLRELSPYPRVPSILDDWADAIDEKVNPIKRLQPGALVELCTTPEELQAIKVGGSEGLSNLRKVFQRRMIDTPGVVGTVGGREQVDASITMGGIAGVYQDKIMEPHFKKLRQFILPDGTDLPDGISIWRHALEMGLGFYYTWDPQPPIEWMRARSEWAGYCREVLKHNKRGLDTAHQVALAVDQGLYNDEGRLAEWRRLSPTFKIKPKAVFLTEEVMEVTGRWLNDNRGIIWVKHVELGNELSRRMDLEYYGREGYNTKGVYIEDHPQGYPLIASAPSNSEGRNLQYKWHQNLILSADYNGKAMEQLTGRTHRPGQPEEEVTFDFYYGCGEAIAGVHQARRDARMEMDVTGQDQKMAYADWLDFPTLVDNPGGGYYRWLTGKLTEENERREL